MNSFLTKGAQTEETMQKNVAQVSDSCDSFDLIVSINKTEVVYQPAPGKPYTSHRKVDDCKFAYLGSTLSRVVHIIDEANTRVA